MTQQRLRHYIAWVHREIDQLLSIDRQGGLPSLDPADRIGLRAEWFDVVDRYLAVVMASDAGSLPADLCPELIALSARLEEVGPVLVRLQLRQPDPAVLARMQLAPAS